MVEKVEFNKDLCDERHLNIHQYINELKAEIKALNTRLNWFYIIAIVTLVGVIGTYFKP